MFEKRYWLVAVLSLLASGVHAQQAEQAEQVKQFSYYTAAVDFQTAISAFVGFAGVIIAMLFNASSQRKLIKQQREHEAQNLRIGFITELKHVVKGLKRTAADLNKRMPNERELASLPFESYVYFFPSVTDKIGLLSGDECHAVISAYAQKEAVFHTFKLIAYYDEKKNILSFDKKAASVAAVSLPNAIRSIEGHIEVLESHLDKNV